MLALHISVIARQYIDWRMVKKSMNNTAMPRSYGAAKFWGEKSGHATINQPQTTVIIIKMPPLYFGPSYFGHRQTIYQLMCGQKFNE